MAATGTVVAQRGTLQIADRVFTKIAGRAAQDVLAAAWAGRAERGRTPKVSVTVSGGAARLTLGVELPFPADLSELALAVQAAVTEQVTELTGTRVTGVAVLVERLVPAGAAR
ncbi:hypothetical protein GCM10010193_61080 [Kitasatospora atroaurantiaca]|uniref:Putative alkaline shock family protein YloU n=1 Tax=Kitasatospora atroaurantiaca TaxID=285545 RepID=A0A561EX43_9ACTN|nr:Asp23/Gls24 family envelope stress response protein [Kitasatospora atroaurantiaca]TWE20173.1 putative alkaline shock family protein YloU [Kitasatospora atroaurantiaca]